MEDLEHSGFGVRVTWFQILPITSKLCRLWVFVHVLITLNLNFLIFKTEVMTSSLEGVLNINETIFVMMVIVT